VVFDRVRENLVRHAGEPFEDVVNHSIMQTLMRSLNTTMTVVLTLLVLMLFGGTTIRPFVLAILIGIYGGRLLGSIVLEHAPGELACR
jgi:preprotein translocase subunit SecF